MELWKKVTTDSHYLNDLLPMKRMRKLRDRSHHDYILPLARTERFKGCFINDVLLILFRFSIYILYFGIYYYAIVVNSPVSLSACGCYFSIKTSKHEWKLSLRLYDWSMVQMRRRTLGHQQGQEQVTNRVGGYQDKWMHIDCVLNQNSVSRQIISSRIDQKGQETTSM